MLVTGLLIHCYSKVVSIISIGDKLHFPLKEILPHIITKPLPCRCCKQHSVLCFFSTLDLAMIQLRLAESQLISEHSVPPHVQVLLHMLVTPVQIGLMEKGSLPVISSCKHWVQICTRLPTVPKRWQGEETCGVVFLGRPLHLTSPVLYNLSLDMVPSGLTPAETWFCGLSAWFALWDQSNVACLVQTPTDHYSTIHAASQALDGHQNKNKSQ